MLLAPSRMPRVTKTPAKPAAQRKKPAAKKMTAKARAEAAEARRRADAKRMNNFRVMVSIVDYMMERDQWNSDDEGGYDPCENNIPSIEWLKSHPELEW